MRRALMLFALLLNGCGRDPMAADRAACLAESTREADSVLFPPGATARGTAFADCMAARGWGSDAAGR